MEDKRSPEEQEPKQLTETKASDIGGWVKHADGSWTCHSSAHQREIAVRHLGIIAQRVGFWYPRLPVHAKVVYGTDDMISEISNRLCAQALRYNAKKARESTWVYWVADNCCREILQRFLRKRRAALEVTELGNLSGREIARYLSQESFHRERAAFSAVEELIATSSDNVRELIALLLRGGITQKRQLPPEVRAAIPELRRQARKQKATFDDFLLVYRST